MDHRHQLSDLVHPVFEPAQGWCPQAEGLKEDNGGRPHHFTLTDQLLAGYDPVFRPPLRTANDIAATSRAADGTIDAIATDHAPHPQESKEAPLDQAPPGMLGRETALALAISELDIPLAAIVAALSWKPAAIAGIGDRHGRPVVAGEPANLVVFDPAAEWTVVPARLASKSRNTPYAGRAVRGKVRHTLLHGVPVVIDSFPQR